MCELCVCECACVVDVIPPARVRVLESATELPCWSSEENLRWENTFAVIKLRGYSTKDKSPVSSNRVP